jgi:hypothetical protein
MTSAANQLEIVHLTATTLDVIYVCTWLSTYLTPATITSNHSLPLGRWQSARSLRVATTYHMRQPDLNGFYHVRLFYSSVIPTAADVPDQGSFL